MKLLFGLAAASVALVAQPATAQGGGAAQTMEGRSHLGLHHAAITVSDIDATVAFYSKAVPYKVVKRYTIKGSAFPKALLGARHRNVEIAVVEMPTGFIQLMDFEPGKASAPNARPVIGPGYTHICFQSSSKDPAILRFQKAGLEIISRFGKPDGVDIGGYGVRYAYGRDPDGIMIENESLDSPKRGEAAWVTHIANTVHDRDTMLAFYEKLLDRKAHRTIEQENRPRLDDVANIDNLSIKGGWFNVGNMEIEVWEYVRPKTPAPGGKKKLDEIGYNAFALEVSDLTRETARLKQLGIDLAGKPVKMGGWQVQYAYDPEGNLFAVQQNVSAGTEHTVAALASAR
ncbi:MAG TPA: VOC family protein [Sphingorhabdus sp.]|nr:VOC family protein [Sphingorhabdus sp.]